MPIAQRQRGLGRIAQHRAVGAHHQRQIGARRPNSARRDRRRPCRWRDRADDAAGRCAPGNSAAAPCRRATAGPISTGPPTPPWIRLTRRRISARMMRSPRSASATSSARSLLRRDQQRLDIALGMAVDQRDAAGKLADLGQELPRPLIDHRRDMAEAVALGDRDMARQHHEHAGAGLAGLEQRLAVPEACALRRTGACARFRAASASEMSARGAETRRSSRRSPDRLSVSALISPPKKTRACERGRLGARRKFPALPARLFFASVI